MNLKLSLGNRKITIQDVASVAYLNNVQIVVEDTKITTGSGASVPDVLATCDDAKDKISLSEPISRALMFQRCAMLIKGRSGIRQSVLDLLIECLNRYLTPQLHFSSCPNGSIDGACVDLLKALQGMGTCIYKDQQCSMEEAFKDAGLLKLDDISPREAATFTQGTPTIIATTALVSAGASGLLSLSDAVAALSCEAFKAHTSPFDVEQYEATHPHRGIITSAMNMRLLLEHSKLANSRGDNTQDPSCIRCIPQYHGPARETIEQATKSMSIELNSVEVGAFDASSSGIGALHSQSCATLIATLGNAIGILWSGSKDRSNLLGSSVEIDLAALSINVETCYVNAALEALKMVSIVADSFVKEAQTALQVIATLENELKAQNAAKANKAQSSSANAEAIAAAAAKEEASLAGMSEEKRKKIEAKRAKKLAAKKAKEASKTSKDELKLGAGTSELRTLLIDSSIALKERLNPFDHRLQSTVQMVQDLLVRLKSGGVRRKPKIAKGAQDFLPEQMQLRERIFNKIRSVFKRHGGVEIETPVFELKETLTGKYGEDSKLIYDLADQGGELLALRYDLTVPFARFMALHNPGNIKRFHIARVYRRDNPQMARGRFREFYQCDFDIAGTYGSMIPDAEVLAVGIEILQGFPQVGPFQVKLSHRCLLDAILAICGVPSDKFRTICSAIDKLDKESWETVRSEMIDEKGLASEVADRIQPFVIQNGHPKQLHAKLLETQMFGNNPDAALAMKELGLLFDYLDAMNVLDYVSFDLSLARGLDYYTGLIYEYVLTSPNNVGSIAAGGRYDNLVGIFSVSGQQIPCVGVSIGIERIFGLLQAHAEEKNQLKRSSTQVLVASTSGGLLLERLALCRLLWNANISAEILQLETPKFTKQLHHALDTGIPYMIVIGESEVEAGTVQVKALKTREEVQVNREVMVETLFKFGCPTTETMNI